MGGGTCVGETPTTTAVSTTLEISPTMREKGRPLTAKGRREDEANSGEGQPLWGPISGQTKRSTKGLLVKRKNYSKERSISSVEPRKKGTKAGTNKKGFN